MIPAIMTYGGRMPIAVFPIGPLETNAYVLHEKQDAVIVDPGGDMRGGLPLILDFLSRNKLTAQAVLLTHLHFDHVLGVAQLLEACPGVKVYASRDDDAILRPSFTGSTWGMPPVRPFEYEPLTPGEYTFGAVSLKVLATPGHSSGSLSFYLPQEEAVIVGDLLFYRSVGRTDLPGSDPQKLVDSLKQHIYTLPPQTTAYPGHGPETVVGDEMKLNPFVRG